MLERLKKIKTRYEQLTAELAAPDAMDDKALWRAKVKEHSNLEEIVTVYDAYVSDTEQLEECRAMLREHLDADMKELVAQEMSELEDSIAKRDEELHVLLLPKDPNDDRNVILEIRAGTGGDEASLFGADLLRMYLRYAERHGYKVEYITENMTELGGVKEVVLSLSGRHGCYSRMKFESGVHRVQRVPETESQGRVHTSAATVAVMPEADDVEIDVKEGDLRIDTYRSSGAGGQHVNKTSSAIRITHIPTGVVVACQNERSQLQNKEQAMRLLKSRLLELQTNAQHEQLASIKKSLVGSGDRSERIRTYNFPQSRVTDHRIGMTLYKLEQFLDGDMDEMIDALIVAERAAQLSGEQE
ncbi:MAG TPA: peptide chain release factor 1 [Eubacteriales bacterium]|nr:peptide chain release factor 1 [Clostridia bacterium]HRV73229.1 peptide chain release factor 1 [Eubacteriales bacterium]